MAGDPDTGRIRRSRTSRAVASTGRGHFGVNVPKATSWESAGGKDSPPFALAPDGKRFAVVLNADGTAHENTFTHLTVLLNFFDELRRRVPAGGK
jgi:hypothetical protein